MPFISPVFPVWIFSAVYLHNAAALLNLGRQAKPDTTFPKSCTLFGPYVSPVFERKFFRENRKMLLTSVPVLAIIIKQSFLGNTHLRLCWNW